ncbi:MAG: hypothetical protein KC431_26825, partial [Myxococcales bacterium]|nr:hypothetical protein [Myxococcales bacterium]
EAALQLLEGGLRATSVEPASLRLALGALRTLARAGEAERLRVRWSLVEDAARRSESVEPVAALVALVGAEGLLELSERADALLLEHLPAHPDDPKLLAAVWQRAEAAVLVHEGEQGRAEVVAVAAAWLERLLARYAIEPTVAARMFAGLASQVERAVDVDAAATMLRERAEVHIRDAPALFGALLEALRSRRRWPEILALLLRAAELDPSPAQADQVGPWLAVAAAAAEDGDDGSELRARVRVADLLLARGTVDDATARRALHELQRALALAPERADLRWRVGVLQSRLRATRPAYEALIGLWEQERWSEAGVEQGELALRCGTLAAELGEREKAVELLTGAHARSDAERSEHVTELLVSALLLVDRRDEVVRLAAARAAELDDPHAAVQWLRRAAELATGARRVELLARARELTPEDDTLVDDLEAELLALGELEALEALLRERLARCREAAGLAGSEGVTAELTGFDPSTLAPDLQDSWLATLGALLTLLETIDARERARDHEAGEGAGTGAGEGEGRDEELGDEPGEAARLRERIRLHEELLLLAPNDTESLLIVAEDRRRTDRRADALELWARAEPMLAADDPRLFDIACRLAERELARGRPALEQGARLRAHQLLERALAQRPEDLDALERRHEVACALDVPKLVLSAAKDLLSLPTGLDDQRRAELEADVARGLSLLDRPVDALAALRRAVDLVTVGSELHRELAQRWLELLDNVGERALFDPDDVPDEPAEGAEVDRDLGEALRRSELAARGELRRALGAELDRGQALRELELMVSLGELDPALERLESLLIAAPADRELRERLRALASEEGLHFDFSKPLDERWAIDPLAVRRQGGRLQLTL